MTTLILAEKPSQARDIAKVIGIRRSGEGYLELNNGWMVSYAIGHLLELAEPEAYDPHWGERWAWTQLPMIPPAFKQVPVTRTKAQLKVVKGLLATATTVIIATDAGREGEYIARELLDHAKYRGKVLRFWTGVLTPQGIKDALDNLLPGEQTAPLYEAAKARAVSDWMLGLTGTRAATLAARVQRDYFPLGRVQTPTLALVCRRDKTIEGFSAKKYFELEATVQTAKGATFKMLHSRPEEKRITDRKEADALLAQANRARGPLHVEKVKDSEKPPLPFSLPGLQKAANRVFGFSAAKTLKVAQALYEKHKMLSYPRTDCNYLSKSQVPEIPGVLEAVSKTLPGQVASLKGVGPKARASTFDDEKLSDHHAIIPTNVHEALTGDELALYTLVAHQYLQVLAPDCEFLRTKVALDANGVPFTTTGKTILVPGWTQFKYGKDDTSDE